MGLERERSAAIIGGLGRMGQVTKELFERIGYTPLISDIKDPTTISAREAIRQCQIVFFSILPIENINTVIHATAGVFHGDHEVLDNATLKNPLKEGFGILDTKGVSICSTHPLCKDDQPLRGQNVLIAPFGRNPQAAMHIAQELYEKAGMVLVHVDFHRHDTLLLFNQLFPHLVNQAIGLVLAESKIDVAALGRIATANSRLSSLAMWRTLVQDPQISAMIVEAGLTQPEGKRIVVGLRRAITQIVSESKQHGMLERSFVRTRKRLDPTGKIRPRMNEQTIRVLERLANLRMHSVTIESDDDQPGLLRTMLAPFEEAGINLNAIDSHKTDGGVRFDLGIESGEITPEVVSQLEALGFRVISP